MKNYNHLLMRLYVLIFLVSFTQGIFAQQSVTGTVMDGSTNQPLIGATVQAKGTSTGVVTDLNGNYTISASPSDILVFSYVGYIDQEVEVGSKSEVNVTLEESFESIQELVVIGYGTVKKDDLTGSVAVVTPEDLNRTPNASITQAMQGRAAGVVVTQSGNPGEGSQVRVRGIGSINRNPNPLYVIDGIISGDISSINPQDIESMQVLKDASATAIYGADGANGVIIITTKRGESGATKISFSAFGSVTRVPKKFDMMDATQYSDFYQTILPLQSTPVTPSLAYTDEFRQQYYGNGWEKGTNWQDEVLKSGYSQNYYLRISGGGENNNYSISTNYYDEAGIIPGENANRISIRANSDFSLGDYIKVGETINIARRTLTDATNYESDPWNNPLVASPLMKVYNDDNVKGFEGPYVPVNINYQGIDTTDTNTGLNDKANPLPALMLGEEVDYNNNLLAAVYLEATPFDWLTYKVTPSVDGNFTRETYWLPTYEAGARSHFTANSEVTYGESIMLSLENQITLSKEFNNHSFNLTGVHHVRKSDGYFMTGSGDGFLREDINTLTNAEQTRVTSSYSPFRSESMLARLIYDYGNKYFVTASFRRDGNSRFGPGNRYGYFPSFSFAWKVNEDLFQNIDAIDMLKLRFGYGQTGNSDIGNFVYVATIDGSNNFQPVFGVGQSVLPGAHIFTNVANPFVQWEAADMFNIGFDLNMYGNKLQLSGEYYNKTTDDLLVQQNIPNSFGLHWDAAKPWVNLGSIRNSGIEAVASYRKKEGVFNYSLTGTFTTVKNEVIEIPESYLEGENITKEGYPIGALYGYVAERLLTPEDFDDEGNYLYAPQNATAGIQTEDIAPGDIKFTDLNKDGVINDLDRTIIGKAIPDFSYSLNIEMWYKDFDFSLFLLGLNGFEVWNFQSRTMNSFADQDLDHNKSVDLYENYYRPDRTSTEYIRADRSNANRNDRASSWWVEDGSFLRIQNVQLGYTLPGRISGNMGISRFRIYLSASNLYTLTGYSGRDPEAPINGSPLRPGRDNGTYPLPRTFTAGVQLDF